MANNSFELSQPGITQLNKSLDTLVASMNKLESRLASLQKNSKSAFEKVFGSQKDFDAIIKSVNKLSLEGVSGLRTLTKTIAALGTALTGIPNPVNLGRFTKIITEISLILKTVVGLTQDYDSLRSIGRLSLSLQQFGLGISTFSNSIQNVSLKKIIDLGKAVGAISVVLKTVANLVAIIPGNQQFNQLGTVFSQFANALRAFITFSNTVNTGKLIQVVVKLALFFGLLGKALGSASNAVAKNQGLENLTKLSEIFSRIGPAITSIIKVADKLPLFNPLKIIKQFLQIRALVNTVTQIAGGLAKQANKLAGNNGLVNLDQLSVIFDRLGRGIRSLIGASSAVSKAKLVNLNPVKELFKSLDPLFKQLRKFKNSTLPDFGAMFQSLFTFATNLKAGTFDVKALRGFRDFAKELAKGLSELQRVRIDAGKLNAIAALLKSLKEIQGSITSNANLGQAGVGIGGNLVDSIAKGILKADFTKFLGNVLFKAFKALNPFTLAKNFIDGMVSVFKTLISIPDALIAKIKEVGTSLITLGGSLKASGLNLINTIGLGGLANSGLFQAAVGFDDLSTQVENFGNLTKEQLKAAQEFSNEIGIKYPQSSNEALKATLNLLKAGLDLEDTFTALPAAADLSSISDTKDLDAASKAIILVTQSFTDFNEETKAGFENAGVAADIIARAANNSTASVESLTAGLANVASVANAAGLSLEETSAILGIFSDAGIAGAEGGTQLKSLLTNLTRDTPAVTDELAKLGVSLKDQAGNIRPFNDIINDLSSALFDTKTVTVAVNNVTADQQPRLEAAQKAYAAAARQVLLYNDGLTAGALDQEKAAQKIGQFQAIQANAQAVIAEITGSQAETQRITTEITRGQFDNFQSIQKLAGSFGQAGLNILLSQGQDALKGFIEEMGRLPTAAEQARLLLDNLKGDTLQLRGSVESLATRAFLPLISRVFRPLVKIGRLVVDFFSSLSDPILETIVNAGVLVSILATLVGGLLIAVGVVVQFGGVILTVVGALGGLIVGLPLVVAALGGLLVAFASLVAVASVIGAVLLGVSSVITTFFRTIENNVGGAGTALGHVQETLGKLFSSIGDIFRIGGDILSTIFGSGVSEQNVALGERIATFFENINDQILILKERIDIVKTFFEGFQAFLALGEEDQTRADLIKQFTDEMPGAPQMVILERVNDQLDRTKKLLSTFATTLAGSSIFQAIVGRDVDQQDVLQIFASLKASLTKVKDAVIASLSSTSSLLLDFLGIKKLNPKQLSSIKNDLNDSLSRIGEIATRAIANLTGINLSEALFSFTGSGKAGGGKDFQKGAASLVKTLFHAIKLSIFENQALITDILSGIFNFALPGKFLEPLLRLLGLDQLADSVSGIFTEVSRLFRGGIGVIFDLLAGKSLDEAIFGNLGETAAPLVRLLKSIGRVIGTVAGFFGDLFNALFPSGAAKPGGDFLSGLLNGLADAFDSFTTFVLEPIRNIATSIITFISGVIGSFNDPRAVENIGKIALAIGGVVTAIVLLGKTGALTSIIGGFKSLLGILLPLLAPVAAIAAGILAFVTVFDAISKGGDFLTNIGNTISGFITSIAEFLGFKITPEQIATFGATISTAINDALSQVPGLITDLGTTLGAPLITKFGEALANGNFQPVVDEVSTAIRNAIGQVPGLITGLGETLGAPLIVKFGEALATGNFQPVADQISTSIHSAIASVPGLITDLGTILSAPLITKFGEALATGNFQPVIDQIRGSIEGAIKAVPSLIVDLGTSFGSPLLVKIGEAFSTGNILGAITAVTEAIVGVITTALGDVPARLGELGATLNLQFLKDLSVTLGEDNILDRIVTSLGSLLALPIETLTTIIGTLGDFGKVIGDIAKSFGTTDAVVIQSVGLAIATVLLTLAGPTILTALTALLAVLTPVIVPILAVVAALLVLKNGIQAIADVISGRKNILEGIGDFFTGIASDALGLIGIEITPEEIADRITTFFNSVNGLVSLFITNAMRQFQNAVSTVIDGILGSLDDARARVDQAAGFLSTGTGDIFFALEAAAKTGDFKTISDQLALAAEKGLDFQPLNRVLRTNFEGIMLAFKSAIPALSDMSDADFSNVVKTLVNANALDDAIATIPADLLPDFYNRLFAIDASQLTALDFSSIKDQIQSGFASGLFDFSQVQDFILKLPTAIVSEEQKQAFLTNLQTLLVPTTPTEVPLTITPTVALPTEENKNKIREDIGLGLLLAGDAGPFPVTVPVQVTPTATPPTTEDIQKLATDAVIPPGGVAPAVDLPVDIQAIVDPVTAQLFADELQRVTDNATAATTNLTLLQAQSILIQGDLTKASTAVAQYALDVDTNTALAELQWTEHSVLVQPLLQVIADALTNIKTKFVEVGVELDTATATYPTKLVTLGTAFLLFVAMAEPPLIRLINRLREVGTNLQLVLDKLAAVRAEGISVDGSGNGPDNREKGGSVFAGQLYEVGENNKSELLRIGGRTYLIPGGNGMVIPASSMAGVAPPANISNSRSVSNSNSIIQVDAPINVQVVAPIGANAQQIGDAVAAKVSPLTNNIGVDVHRILINAGSSRA